MLKQACLALALISAGALAGCAQISALEGISSTSISTQAAGTAVEGFDTVSLGVAAYLSLPMCGATASAACQVSKASSQAIYTALKAGRAARGQLEALIIANQQIGTIPIASYNSFMAAYNSLSAIAAQYNIKPVAAS